MSKYNPLEEYLTKKATITLTLKEIETIIQDSLPASAYNHRAWWANPNDGSHPYARSWLNAGWKVHTVELGKSVTFIRYS
jgi:hypothetical protein